MKVGPFTPPDVRRAMEERARNPCICVETVPDISLDLAGFQVTFRAHEAVPLDFAERRFLEAFLQPALWPSPDFIVQARRLPERLERPSGWRPEELSVLGEDGWELYSFVSHLRWDPRSPQAVVLEYHGTLLDAVDALRLFLGLQLLYRRAGVLLHAAAAVWRDVTYVFLGPSGAGKSTSAAYTPGRVLSDEMVAVCVEGPSVSVVGTPFGGELIPSAGRGERPVFWFVEKNGKNARYSISPRNALERLLSQTVMLRQAPPAFWAVTMELLGKIIETCPVEVLEAAPGGTFWKEL